MARRARTLSIFGVAVVVATALAGSGCSSFKKATDGWFGPKSSNTASATIAAPSQAVFYANLDGLKVYSAPSSASKVLGVLSLHERVTRSKVDRGYAYVESTETGLKGWTNNAQLLWRLPAASSAAPNYEGAPGVPAVAQPEAPAAPATTETTVTEPAATTTTTVSPAAPDSETPSPSILDSY